MLWNKTLRRALRYTSVAELAVNYARRTSEIPFPELGLSVSAGPGDIIIDCGANIGDIASRLARTGATVHAFEPNPLCYKIISRRFAALSNVHCYHKGVMDRACTLTLETPVNINDHMDYVDVTVAASFVNSGHVGAVDSVEVDCIDLADFITALGKPIKLLKIDIEGAEIAVLNHLLDRGLMDRVELAVVETHERFSEEQAWATESLANRIAEAGLASRIRLDWI